MSRSRHRPPKLEPRTSSSSPAPEPTVEDLVARARIAGKHAGPGPGPAELRHFVDHIVAGDHRALGELAPIAGLTPLEAWAAMTAVFGATAECTVIDPARTVGAVRDAVTLVHDAARRGARVAVATARPASLLTVHLAFAQVARACGAEVADLSDAGPIRADGRGGRSVRWIDGVAVVTDGHELAETRDGEAAREWLFAMARPALVVADGPFAEIAWEAGIEVVALAGLDRPALAVAAARGHRCRVIPLRTDRSPRDYSVIQALVAGRIVAPPPSEL